MSKFKKKVVAIEDEEDILEVIKYNLEREFFQVYGARDGEEGLKKIQKEIPSIVLLDLMLPRMDGLEVCRRLKQDARTSKIPVIMVTAKGEEADIVLGLGLGADDYVTKPFSPRELTARVKAVLRRGEVKAEVSDEDMIQREGLRIDPIKHEVSVDGDTVFLTATEFRLLHFLASHPGRVFSRDHLLHRVIRDESIVVDRNIDVHIQGIRKKIGVYRKLIETIRSIGYRFQDVEN